MTIQLHLKNVLEELDPRRDPYWGAPLSRGHFVGYRKIAADRATWIARMRNDQGRQKFQSLGYATAQFGYDQAKAAALTWFASEASPANAAGKLTVEDACRAYVADRRVALGDKAAHEIDLRFRRVIYGQAPDADRRADRHEYPKHPIASRYVGDLTVKLIKDWRDGLTDRRRGGAKKGARSVNRDLGAFKAALNLAATEHRLSADLVKEWADVEQMAGGNVRTHRELYLDVKERRAFLAKITDAHFRALAEAGALTGARVGELTQLTVGNFDARAGSLTLNYGKVGLTTGPRTIPLNTQAIALFKRCAKGKARDALLLPMANGTRWHHSSYDHLVKLAAAAAGLPHEMVFYTLRHCWITQALTDGMGPFEVAKMAGTSVKMIDDHYGHLVQSQARSRLAKVRLL